MSSVDWPSVHGNHGSLPTIVSPSDLFDGELFGDELIDIYDRTVAEGGDVDVEHNGTCFSIALCKEYCVLNRTRNSLLHA
jgi:hypothetical protein